MAVLTLFISNIADVKARLRLSGVPAGVDADKMIEEAIRAARVFFYRRLSIDRITEIANFVQEMNPVTNDGVIRQLAEITELKAIRYELLRTMPTLFYDSAPTTQQMWNEEGMLRGTKPDEREMEMRRLEADLEQSINLLGGSELMPNETEATTSVFVSKSPNPRPYESVFGIPLRIWW